MHGVCLGTICLGPSPKVSGSPSQPRKQVEPLLLCPYTGYQGSVRTNNTIPSWPLKWWKCAWGVPWNTLSPAESKSQRFPISAQKAGTTTFVVPFYRLTGQCEKYQQNSFLAPSKVELCMGCALEHFVSSRVQKYSGSPSQPRKQVEQLL